ncbi:S-layer homology domain-containing protein [Paenibacillus mesotrionivorans]|uniref:S-layer homology domain-containing protein n=1 Tax=Paenibacillus mesotrionivorans TaxID=3160968 RepID=A0ACC7P4Z4_9BACL
MQHQNHTPPLSSLKRLTVKATLAAALLSSAFTGIAAAEDNPTPAPAAGSTAPYFTDISGSYAQKEILALAQAGILSGYEEGHFFPERPITRAELAKVLVLATGRSESSSPTGFADVPADSWYRRYVAALVEAGITEGSSASGFSPDAYVTREELVVFFTRAMGLDSQAAVFPADAGFTDFPQVADWAKPSVALAYKIGFVNGLDNEGGALKFAPRERAERQALALLAYSCWTRQTEFTAKAEDLLGLTPAPSSLPAPAPTGKPPSLSSPGQLFRVIKAAAYDRTTVLVTLDKAIENEADVRAFSFPGGLDVKRTAVKAGTPTVVLTTGQQTPGEDYRLYYDEGNTFTDITGSADYLTGIDGDRTGIFKLSQADAVYGPLAGTAVIQGDLYIDAPRVKLRNVKVTGKLVITEQTGSEPVYLENVQVEGETLVLGSGKGGIHLTGTLLHSLTVNNLREVTDIVAGQGTRVLQTTLASSAVVNQLRTREPVPVFEQVVIPPEAPAQSYVSLQGRFNTVDVHSPVFLQAPEGSIGKLNLPASSKPVVQTDMNLPILEKAVMSNGKVELQFSRKPETSSISDFDIEATVGEKPVSLDGWTYEAQSGTLLFPALAVDSTELLKVSIRAKNGVFAGHLHTVLSGISGRISNKSGLPVGGIRIVFRPKTADAKSGGPSWETVTDQNGHYSIRLSPGSYIGEIIGDSFLRTQLEGVAASAAWTPNVDALAIETLKDNEFRMVLSWGLQPRDLDAHLLGPDRTGRGNDLHSWYKDEFRRNGSPSNVELDRDDPNSPGMETITVRKPANGHYVFYAHQYSGVPLSPDGSLATVRVYQGSNPEPLYTYSMPLAPGGKEYWVVFQMTVKNEDISFTARNEFTDSDPWNNVGKLGNNTEIRSRVYPINNGIRWIEKIPQGTTVEAFKQTLSTIDPAAHLEVYEQDRTTVRTGIVQKFDIVVITGANGLARRELEVRTEDTPPAAGPEVTIAALYASSDNTVTGAVYSQQNGSQPNSSVNPLHIPSSAPHLLVQFNQELSPDQEGLQVYVNDSLLPSGSVQVLPDRILALNLSQVSSGREAVIKITHLKITGGQLKANPVTVYIYKES